MHRLLSFYVFQIGQTSILLTETLTTMWFAEAYCGLAHAAKGALQHFFRAIERSSCKTLSRSNRQRDPYR